MSSGTAPCAYVVTGEVYRDAGTSYDTRSGPRSGFSDSELPTVSIVSH